MMFEPLPSDLNKAGRHCYCCCYVNTKEFKGNEKKYDREKIYKQFHGIVLRSLNENGDYIISISLSGHDFWFMTTN